MPLILSQIKTKDDLIEAIIYCWVRLGSGIFDKYQDRVLAARDELRNTGRPVNAGDLEAFRQNLDAVEDWIGEEVEALLRRMAEFTERFRRDEEETLVVERVGGEPDYEYDADDESSSSSYASSSASSNGDDHSYYDDAYDSDNAQPGEETTEVDGHEIAQTGTEEESEET